jgi:hypothetical protein
MKLLRSRKAPMTLLPLCLWSQGLNFISYYPSHGKDHLVHLYLVFICLGGYTLKTILLIFIHNQLSYWSGFRGAARHEGPSTDAAEALVQAGRRWLGRCSHGEDYNDTRASSWRIENFTCSSLPEAGCLTEK